MRLRRWVAIAIGFLGVVVILRPGSTLFDPWIMSAVFAAIGLAGVNLLMKYLAEREATNRILAWNLMISVPVALVLALPFWTTPSLPILGLLLLQGGLGALAQFSAARAMRLADVSVLTAIEFVRLPLVALIAYVLFGEISGFWTWMGAAIIIGSTLYLVRREAKLGRQDSVSSRHEG